jgi:hypothetical protein
MQMKPEALIPHAHLIDTCAIFQAAEDTLERVGGEVSGCESCGIVEL